jgi:hypothetical protein
MLTGVAVVVLGVVQVDWGEEVGAGDFFVGAGTLALAVGTVWLGRHAARQADLAKQSIEDAERPFVIATPHDEHPEGLGFFQDDDGGLWFYYRLWNIGRGPALVIGVGLRELDDGRELMTFSTPRALATNGAADMEAKIPKHTEPLPTRFTLRVLYQDGSRRAYLTEEVLWLESGPVKLLTPGWFDQNRLERGDVRKVWNQMRASDD